MEWRLISPELTMAVLALVVILVDLVVEKKHYLPIISAIGLVIPLGAAIRLWDEDSMAMNDMLAVDNFAIFFKVLIIVITAMPLQQKSKNLIFKI